MTDATSLPPPSQQDQRLWYELKTLTELLDERGDELSAMEFNGLLRTAFRLRKAFFSRSPQFLTPEQNYEAMGEIDGVLNYCVLKLPVIAPTAEDWRRWVAESRL